MNKSITVFAAALTLVLGLLFSVSRTPSSEAATQPARAQSCSLTASNEAVVALNHPTSWTCSAPTHWCPNVQANCAQGVNCNLCAQIGATCP